MAKHAVNKKDQRDIKQQAQKLASLHKVEGQSKEHTKIIAQGIQKGLEQYLREHSGKSRELDKQTKKLKKRQEHLSDERNALESGASDNASDQESTSGLQNFQSWLPWGLLIISWVGFISFYNSQA